MQYCLPTAYIYQWLLLKQRTHARKVFHCLEKLSHIDFVVGNTQTTGELANCVLVRIAWLDRVFLGGRAQLLILRVSVQNKEPSYSTV